MNETMMIEAARELAARLKTLLDQGMDAEIRLTRDEALLAQAFAEGVADLLSAQTGRAS